MPPPMPMAPETTPEQEMFQNADPTADPMASQATDGYADVVRELGAVYDKMRGIVERANRAGDMPPADEQEMNGLRARYDRLVRIRDLNHDVAKRSAASVQRSYAIERAERQMHGKNTEQRLAIMSRPEYRDAFATYLQNGFRIGYEQRDMVVGTDTDGGFLPSQDFYNKLQKVLEQEVIFRKISTVMPLGTFKTNIAVENAIVRGSWGAEAAAVAETSPTFVNRVLEPKRLAVTVKASMELIEDAPSRGPGFSVETIVSDQMARGFALDEEDAFAVGAASNKPKGIFTYTAASQISDGVTAASATAFTANEIIDLIYSLPRQYRTSPGVAIVCNEAALAAIRKLTNPGSGTSFLSYLWEPSFKLGEPDRIMGIPVYPCQFAPAIATGTRPIIIGDFSRFIIGTRTGLSVRVLRELYAGTGQVGYQGVERIDAVPTVFNAFRYLKMA